MKIARSELLARLNEASVGVSAKETIEYSNCFVFRGKRLYAYDGERLARTANPLGFDAVVNAADLLQLIARVPDDELEVYAKKGELIVKGARRVAGIACAAEASVAADEVEFPSKWARLEEGTAGALQQAAKTCGNNEAQPLASYVHATPGLVEACDNFRFLRIEGKTGFGAEALLPAASVAKLDKAELVKVAVGKGWVFFATATGAEVAVRASHEPYHKGLDKLLAMKEGQKVTLPQNLGEMIERASVFHTGDYDARVGVRIADGVLRLEARKEGGWYRERKKIDYRGRPLSFEVHPDFLVEVLRRTRDVWVNDNKMKLETGPIRFVVCLDAKEEKEEE